MINDIVKKGIVWNSIGVLGGLSIEFLFGIGLAHILAPSDFGILALITIFISISELFVNSGFSQALIRKLECTDTDYSTAFYFNVFSGFVVYTLLYLSAPYISIFYNNQELTTITRVVSLSLLINSLTLVQNAIFVRSLNFKAITKLKIFTSFISGTIAIVLAILGFGVWSLIAKTLLRDTINSTILWFKNKWIPCKKFDRIAFKELFRFGNNLLISGLLGIIANNITNLIIAKRFSITELGFYNRAEFIKNLGSVNISGIFTGVSYPALAKLQNNLVNFKALLRQTLLNSTFCIACIMGVTGGLSKQIVYILLGPSWIPSHDYLKLLSFIGFLYPTLTININLFSVIGNSQKYLKLNLMLQISSLIMAIVAHYWGIKTMITTGIIAHFIFTFVFIKSSSKFTSYELKEQLFDISKNAIIFIALFCTLSLFSIFDRFPPIFSLMIGLIISLLTISIISLLQKNISYYFITKQLSKIFTK